MAHLATLLTTEHGGAGSASDTAFRRLWEWLVAGDAEPGQRLSENDLAARFQVSRTPLRDAIHRMEGIGLVERRLNRTLVVKPMSVAEMTELSTTRERLEGLVAHAVAERFGRDAVSLDGLKALNDRMARLAAIGEVDLLLAGGQAFHAELKRLGGNPVAARMLDQLMLALERYRLLVHRETVRSGAIVEEHAEVLGALESADPEAAEATMRRHIASARAFYRGVLADLIPAAADTPVPPPEALV